MVKVQPDLSLLLSYIAYPQRSVVETFTTGKFPVLKDIQLYPSLLLQAFDIGPFLHFVVW